MESTGYTNRIHVSESTAELIKAAGKGHWIHPRAERIEAKGKGSIQTYWCELKSSPRSNSTHKARADNDDLDFMSGELTC
jgi:Adenylate and Guanylate cyclase catalytic domain